MSVKRAILKTEPGKAQDVLHGIGQLALDEGINITATHIAGDIITVHCPQEHFNKVSKIKGVIQTEEAKPLPLIKQAPSQKK